MVQSKKKRTDSRPVEKAPGSKATEEARKRIPTGYIITASVVVVVILIVVLVSLYLNAAPFRTTIITVDDTSIKMNYFLKRTELHGADPFTMLDVLTKEQLIKLEAPQYVGEVTPEDIDRELRKIARGESETISDSEFKEWYRQQLNEVRLSDSEFKEYVATNLLAARLHQYLAQRVVPTVAEQVHLHSILVATYEDAEKTRARWEAGEKFADLAREVSLDEQSREKGGDLGWFPRGVLLPGLEYVAFDLSPGEVSEPIPFATDPSSTELVFYLVTVSEQADAREIDEDALAALRSKVLDDWLSAEMQLHEIRYYGFNNGFDSETHAWINLQLAKMAKK